MSIEVDINELTKEIAQRPFVYLLSSIMDSRPHVSAGEIEVAQAEGQVEIRMPIGETARHNCAQRPAVTLLWPQVSAEQKNLVVDGDARLDGTGHVIVTALHAVLYG